MLATVDGRHKSRAASPPCYRATATTTDGGDSGGDDEQLCWSAWCAALQEVAARVVVAVDATEAATCSAACVEVSPARRAATAVHLLEVNALLPLARALALAV